MNATSQIIMQCLQFLSGQCDGARDTDGVGFNGGDTRFGKEMATYHTLTDRQEKAALKMLQKYRRQLETAGLELPHLKKDDTMEEEQPDEPTTEPVCTAVDDLRNGGTLSKSLPGYQERLPQIEMAQLVTRALEEETHAIIEAATGTGKSLGYLIPIVRSGKRAIVSTANKALQDQLFNKDVPFLQKHLQSFDVALVKGMGNYVCLDRLSKELNEGLGFFTQDASLVKVDEATNDETFNGDFESLPFTVPGELKARINGNPEECARKKCPLYQECYYYKMRRSASDAQIIITNHALLMINVVSGGKLLPHTDAVIVDEAHVLEGVATDAFTIEIRPGRVLSLLSLKKLKQFCEPKTLEDAERYAMRLWEQLAEHMPEDRKVSRIALLEKIESGLLLSSAFTLLANQLKIRKPTNMTDKEDGLYDRLVERTVKLAEDLHAAFSLDNSDYVYYLERSQTKSGEQISVFMTPLTVARLLRESFFTDEKVVLTSATLATPGKDGQPSFDFFRQQIGLDDADTITKILPLVFDYRKNAVLYLPDDMPVPAYGQTQEAKAYEAAMAQKMLDLVEASQGRAFLLFSSRRMMDIVLRLIRSKLTRDGFTLLVQGEYPTGEMIKRFKSSEKAVLFGLRTFWEGVDVSGEKLSLVVIDKLPFVPADDPVSKAKEQYIERVLKEKPFYAYSLPMVVLQLKQGVGRLIRSDSDTGVMAILDARMRTGSYGKRIVSCLPPAQQVGKIAEVRGFFNGTRPVQQDLFAEAEVPKLVEVKIRLSPELIKRAKGRDLSELVASLLDDYFSIDI